jgi:hypothetical protein
MARRRGRPSKLTPEVRDRFLNAIRAGNYYSACAGYAGIDEQTFRNWRKRGEDELKRLEESRRRRMRERERPYVEFVLELRAAEAEAEVRMVTQWQAQMPTDWRAARAFLATRYPERWAPKPIEVDVDHRVAGRVVFETVVEVPPPVDPPAIIEGEARLIGDGPDEGPDDALAAEVGEPRREANVRA